MSSSTFNSRTAWTGVSTETVAVSALAVGDAVYKGVDLAPMRVRALDHFPDGHINVVASPASLLAQVPWESLGVFAPTDTVRRVVMP